MIHRLPHRIGIDFLLMISKRPLQDGATIGDFSGEHIPGHDRRKFRIIGASVLFPAKQDVAGNRPLNPRQERPRSDKKLMQTLFSAQKSHQIRAATNIAKADDSS
jgi:hypothetical protein